MKHRVFRIRTITLFLSNFVNLFQQNHIHKYTRQRKHLSLTNI